MASSIGVKPLFIAIPWTIAYRLLQLTEMLDFRLSFTSENILGLKDLKTFDTIEDLEAFGLRVKDYQTTLDQLYAKQ